MKIPYRARLTLVIVFLVVWGVVIIQPRHFDLRTPEWSQEVFLKATEQLGAFSTDRLKGFKQNMVAYGKDWLSSDQFLFQADAVSNFQIPVSVPHTGDYTLTLAYTAAVDYMPVQVVFAGQTIELDTSSDVVEHRTTSKAVSVSEGKQKLLLLFQPKPDRQFFGLDYIHLQPVTTSR